MKLFQLFESKELVSELLWFQRYISDHDLETELEIENDKIIFRAGENLIELNVANARRIRNIILPNAGQSFRFAESVIKCRFELGEPVISKDEYYSYLYAKYVIKGRFELGEPVILKSVEYSRKYQDFLTTMTDGN